MTTVDDANFLQLLKTEGWQFKQIGNFSQIGYRFELPEFLDDGPIPDGETGESVMRDYLNTLGISANIRMVETIENPDDVFVDVATKLLESMQADNCVDPVAFLKRELDARKNKKRGQNYAQQFADILTLTSEINRKAEKFATDHQGDGTWFGDLGSVIENLKDINNFLN